MVKSVGTRALQEVHSFSNAEALSAKSDFSAESELSRLPP